MAPPVGYQKAATRSTRVLFPAPLYPTRATISPRFTDRLTPHNASFPDDGYLKKTLSNTMSPFTVISSPPSFSDSHEAISPILSIAVRPCWKLLWTRLRRLRGVNINPIAARKDTKSPGVILFESTRLKP